MRDHLESFERQNCGVNHKDYLMYELTKPSILTQVSDKKYSVPYY